MLERTLRLPKNVDEVIERLDEIIVQCEKDGSRLGYFAALYKRVTVEIKDKIDNGYFDDNERMEHLDVVFASRYLEAYYRYQKGETTTKSWEAAFTATKSWNPLVIQHLFIGMNAHIGLDLGIAAAIIQPNDTESLHDDFNKVNTVLGSLVDEVQDELSEIWPLLKPIDKLAGRMDEEIADFTMKIARDAAWKVALEYSALTTVQAQEEYLLERDKKVADFGWVLYKPSFVLWSIMALIRLGEIGSVRSKIRKLNK